MLIWSFLIPIVTCIILLVFFRRETQLWECLVVFFPSIIATGLIWCLIRWGKIQDTRYTSEIVVAVRHYDPWNEYIERTCTREVAVGTDKDGNTIYETETYDCSYVEYHQEYWEMRTKTGRKERIERKIYDYHKKLWGTEEKFIDMHRNYHTIDGDAQEYLWCGEKEHTLTLASREHFENYFKLQGNLFSQEEIDPGELNLPKYPEKGYKGENGFWIYDQNTIIGVRVSDEVRRFGRWINSQDPKFRVHIVYFKNKDISISRALEKYWLKGKDNDVVFCIGLDERNRKSWIYSFSWSPEPQLEGYVKMESKTGSPEEILRLSWKAYKKGYWKPRDFSEYSYITIDLTPGDYALIFWITIIINIICSIWVIKNDYRNETYNL